MAETIGVIIGIAFVIIFVIALITKRDKGIRVMSIFLLIFMLIAGIIALFKGDYVVAILATVILIYGATR